MATINLHKGVQIHLLPLTQKAKMVFPCPNSSGFNFCLLNHVSLEESLKDSKIRSYESQFLSHCSRDNSSCSSLLLPHSYSFFLVSLSILNLLGSRVLHKNFNICNRLSLQNLLSFSEIFIKQIC